MAGTPGKVGRDCIPGPGKMTRKTPLISDRLLLLLVNLIGDNFFSC